MDGVARVAKEGGDGRVAGHIEEEDSADEAEVPSRPLSGV